MDNFIKYTDYKINNSPDWELLKIQYFENYENFKGKKEIKIPKIIHQIWLGSNLPKKYDRLVNTWKEKNENWEYVIWNDDNISEFKLNENFLYSKSNNVGIKSDILRYEILYKYGGICVDTDFECLKSHDDLTYLDFFAGNGYTVMPYVFCGILASKPKHSMFGLLLDELRSINSINNKLSNNDVLKISGPDFFTKKYFDYMHNNNLLEKNVVFPKQYFYAVPPSIRHQIREDSIENRKYTHQFISDVSYCIHLWYTSWQK